MNEQTITMIEHDAGATIEHQGTFRPVTQLGDDCWAGVTEIALADSDPLFVPTIINAGRIYAYHDWQAANPEEVAAGAISLGHWLDTETDKLATWLDGKPHVMT
jgi:hypothetical protein